VKLFRSHEIIFRSIIITVFNICSSGLFFSSNLVAFFHKRKIWEINSFQYLKGLFNEQTDPKASSCLAIGCGMIILLKKFTSAIKKINLWNFGNKYRELYFSIFFEL
jgi:hypothetical protein